VFSKQALSAVFRRYTGSTAYLQAGRRGRTASISTASRPARSVDEHYGAARID
jgi:hypothetical protein